MVLVRDALSIWIVAGGTLVMAGAMVSTLKVPKFRRGEGLPQWTMFVGLAAFIAFLARPSALTWHIWNGWNFTLIVANYVQLARKGHLQAAKKERHLKAAA